MVFRRDGGASRRVSNVYVMDAWISNPEYVGEDNNDEFAETMRFTRQLDIP